MLVYGKGAFLIVREAQDLNPKSKIATVGIVLKVLIALPRSSPSRLLFPFLLFLFVVVDADLGAAVADDFGG